MCGISVLVDRKGRAIDPGIVAAMNQRVVHRGPDDEGVFVGEGFGLGHRRLSILDLSSAGHQPMAFQDRSVVTYNGEIYNYVELREELVRLGYVFRSTTDTEVLLAAYDCWGRDCVRRFNGMWSFVLWDRRERLLFCSRDRFGVKPMHYVQLPGYFAVASEVKQFLAVPGFEPRLDEIAAYRFLVEGQLSIDERGFFAGVRELRGGHTLIYELATGEHRVERWYELEATPPEAALDFETAAERFKALFFDAVRLRLRSDVAVGSCLSGGVDSSSIVTAVRAMGGPASALETVSAAWDDLRCDESRHFEQVTAATGFASIVTRPRMDELLTEGALDRIIYHQDQPILGASHFAEYGVFRAAREHDLVVMLDGQGADEYLAGYTNFFPAFIRGQLCRSRWWPALREIRQRSRLRGAPVHAIVWSLLASGIGAPLRQRLHGSGMMRRRIEPWLGRALLRVASEPDAAVPRHWRAGSIRELSITQLLSSSVPYQLHSEDRNSMLHSIESRLPFLDYRLVEFGLSLPDEFKLRDGATKAVVREGLRGVLPEAIRTRHDKVGFAAPEQPFIIRHAPRIRRELESAVAGFPRLFQPALLTGFDAMVTGTEPYSSLYFRALAFRRWAELFGVS
jgi:asparagine synthase (glutamine-hydrolysing)